MMRTLLLNPPSYEGFDGGAGARYQAKREIRSFWYPTWLAQPAAIVPDSLLIDAPPAGLTLADVIPLARRHDLAVLHTSSPTFAGDVRAAEALKAENPSMLIGFVGPKVAVEPESSLLASAAIDFVAPVKSSTSQSPMWRRGSRWPPSTALASDPGTGSWCTTLIASTSGFTSEPESSPRCRPKCSGSRA
jgi:hypothetical protein